MPAFQEIFSGKKVVFLDLDGTVYLGDVLIPGADRFLEELRRHHYPHYFLSNNSSRSKEDYVKKLSGLGIPAEKEQIILSSDGVIAFLLSKKTENLYIVGTESMKRMFAENGFVFDSPVPDFIILGYDTELTYDKLKRAALHMLDGVPLIATHCDLVCPTPEGPIPDVGSMLALFEKATGKGACKIFGKPNPEMIGHILLKHGAAPREAVMIGDRLYTDMELAGRVGCEFILVLSGETTNEDLEKNGSKPRFIFEKIGDILKV